MGWLGLIFIALFAVMVVVLVVAKVAQVLRAANDVVKRNDPRSPHYRH